MEAFLTYLLSEIVTDTESIKINKIENDESITFEISVSSSEFGKIIGKKGKTINAIRILCNLHSHKNSDSSKKIFIQANEA